MLVSTFLNAEKAPPIPGEGIGGCLLCGGGTMGGMRIDELVLGEGVVGWVKREDGQTSVHIFTATHFVLIADGVLVTGLKATTNTRLHKTYALR